MSEFSTSSGLAWDAELPAPMLYCLLAGASGSAQEAADQGTKRKMAESSLENLKKQKSCPSCGAEWANA
jgi:hypothetical protein